MKRTVRSLCVPLLAFGAFAAIAASPIHPRSPDDSLIRACTLAPGRTLALLRVERDTTLPFSPARVEPMSYSGVPRSAADSLLATPGTPMPAARVRLLQVDSTTRDALVRAGISDSQPMAFIRGAPYRADCRTIRWTDSVPWVQRGDTGFARATLAPRGHWIGGVPVLVIPEVWYYPYPRQRGLAYGAPPDAVLAPADAMYSLSISLEVPRVIGPRDASAAPDTARRARALAWARLHPAASELEPARSLVRRAVLDVDWAELTRTPSRLRGTYRVIMESDGVRGTWYFRTHDRPGYSWRDADTVRTTANLLASPHAAGYMLAGYAAGASDELPTASPTGSAMRRAPLVWLAAADRPTAPGNHGRSTLPGALEFKLSAAPVSLWDHLEAFVRPLSPMESELLARMRRQIERAERQPRLPLTLRVDAAGGVRGDTVLTRQGTTLRVSLARIDTLSVKRPF